jgi:hypothetical protein
MTRYFDLDLLPPTAVHLPPDLIHDLTQGKLPPPPPA